MRLTRRDALAALAASGAAGAGAYAVGTGRLSGEEEGDGDGNGAPRADADSDATETLVAVAEVVYPSEVTGLREFVEAYASGRASARPDRTAAVREATGTLDGYAERWYGAPFAELSVDDRDRLLRELGCDTAEEAPDGTTAERLRFHLVNELLFALYASPTGGELVGVENPQGHAGGTESYRRGPER